MVRKWQFGKGEIYGLSSTGDDDDKKKRRRKKNRRRIRDPLGRRRRAKRRHRLFGHKRRPRFDTTGDHKRPDDDNPGVRIRAGKKKKKWNPFDPKYWDPRGDNARRAMTGHDIGVLSTIPAIFGDFVGVPKGFNFGDFGGKFWA